MQELKPSDHFARIQRTSVLLEITFAAQDWEAYKVLCGILRGLHLDLEKLYINLHGENNGKEEKPHNTSGTGRNKDAKNEPGHKAQS